MKLTQAGDTIVEVLVCIAVVSVMLSGAFVVTRQSQTGVRNSQEHAEALRLIESQVEQLRGNPAAAEAYNPQPFCMVNGSPVSDNTCAQSDVSQEVARYNISINRCTSPSCDNNLPNSYLFIVLVQWPEVTGNGTAQESFVYRMY